MINRLIAIMAAAAMALATAFGGVALAGTTKHRTHTSHHRAHAVSGGTEEPGTDEPGSEEPGDGPGGHEDEPGAEVDHQFEGEE